MENPVYNPDPEAFDHVDDFVDDVPGTEDFDEKEEDDRSERRGCMPGPEEFD